MEDQKKLIERSKFQEKLAQYLLIARDQPERLQICVWDESGFSLRVIRRKNWGKQGKRKNVTGKRRCGRVNVMGAIREVDRKRVRFFIKKGFDRELSRTVMQIFFTSNYNN